MSHLAISAPGASTLPEQSITSALTAEIMNDPDDGRPTLVAYTDGNAGDLQEVVPARLLRMVAEARKQLDAIERLAKVVEAQDTLAAILAEHHAQLEEWSTESADPILREKFVVAAMLEDGQLTIVVPPGQDPILRTAAVAELVNDLEERAA